MDPQEQEVKKEETKKEIEKKQPLAAKMREIIIATDGNNINLVKAEVAGNLEMVAILQALIERFKINS